MVQDTYPLLDRPPPPLEKVDETFALRSFAGLSLCVGFKVSVVVIIAGGIIANRTYSMRQSISESPCDRRNSLQRLKWRQPKNPLYADRGEG